jgi:hypothetical protein
VQLAALSGTSDKLNFFEGLLSRSEARVFRDAAQCCRRCDVKLDKWNRGANDNQSALLPDTIECAPAHCGEFESQSRPKKKNFI